MTNRVHNSKYEALVQKLLNGERLPQDGNGFDVLYVMHPSLPYSGSSFLDSDVQMLQVSLSLQHQLMLRK